MFSKCEISLLMSLTSLCVFVLSPFSVESFMLDAHMRAKLKLQSQKLEESLKKYALNAATVGSPLFLSPIIKKGDFAGAQRQATVPPLLPGIQSFAGYITVNEPFGSNLFFWLFKSMEGDWKANPLIIWLQGGPGVSSMFGLFDEVGPFYVDKDGKLVKREYAWCRKYNLMFIDQPVGTGFSFTKKDAGYVTNDLAQAKDLYSFTAQFYAMFPELKKNPLFILGESYAGKYVPSIAHYIHMRNKENKGLIVPLAAVAIGNGFSDPLSMISYSEYLYQLGFIDRAAKDEMRKLEDETTALVKAGKWAESNDLQNQVLTIMYNRSKLVAPYNYIKDVELGFRAEAFLGKPEVRRALHVGAQKFFFMGDDKVGMSLANSIMQSVKPLIEDILNWEAFPIVFYSGQLDIICAYPLSEAMFYSLKWKRAADYQKAKRCPIAGAGSESPVGYFKTAGALTEIMFRNCGHMVPTDQPLVASNFLDTLIGNRTAGFKCI